MSSLGVHIAWMTDTPAKMLINPGEDLATNNYLSQKQNKDAIQGRDFASRRAPFRHRATMDVYTERIMEWSKHTWLKQGRIRGFDRRYSSFAIEMERRMCTSYIGEKEIF